MKKRVNIALGSGGWRGLAHIGVIKSLLKHGYSINHCAGTSAGALIGGLYCYWQNIEKVESVFKSLQYKDLLFAFSDPSTRLGLFRGSNTLLLFQKYIGAVQIEDLPITFTAVATNVETGQRFIFDHGELALAIRASSSVPLVFEPVIYEGKILVDGGISNPIPVDIAQHNNNFPTIAVNIYDCIFPIKKAKSKLSKIDVIMLADQLMLNQLSIRDSSTAAVIVTPKLTAAQSDPFTRFINNSEAIDAGEMAMDEKINQLDSLIVSLP